MKYETLFLTARNVFVLSLLLFLFDALFLFEVRSYVRIELLFFLFLVSGFFLCVRYVDTRQNGSQLIFQKIFLYLFLVSCAVIIFANQVGMSTFLQFVFYVLTFILGLIVVYYYNEFISLTLKKFLLRQRSEALFERKRKKLFPLSFPRLQRIPFIRRIASNMYSVGWQHSLVLVLIFVLGIVLRAIKLGDFNFRNDEFQVVGAAASYLFDGVYTEWNWLQHSPGVSYTRAWPHSFLISKAFSLFGISEWVARSVSLAFGILLLIGVYYFTRYFTDRKDVSLLVTFLIAIGPEYIKLSRYTRMYVILIPLFLLMMYVFYRAITGSSLFGGIFKTHFNYHYGYLFFGLVLLYFAKQIHINSLLILPCLFLFVIYKYFQTKEQKYFILVLFGISGLLLYFFTDLLPDFSSMLSFFGVQNYTYIDQLARYIFTTPITYLLLFTTAVLTFFFARGEQKDKLIYLQLFFYFGLFFFIFIGDRYVYHLYMSHFMPILIIITVYSFVFLSQFVKQRLWKIAYFSLIVIFALVLFFQSFAGIYVQNPYGRLSEAYDVIEEEYREGDIILMQYPQSYYFQDLPPDAPIIDMLNNQEFTLEMFYEAIEGYDRGWLAWTTRKALHVDTRVRALAYNHFEQLHGEGGQGKNARIIDDTRVEVFFFDKSMLPK